MAERNPPAGGQSDRAQPHAALGRRLIRLPDELGTAAIPVLRAALRHPDPWVRLHAVHALARIDHPDAHAALVETLHDEAFGVHWGAAEALAHKGEIGVLAVLRALQHDTPGAGFLHGATHVLRHAALTPEQRLAVAPVLDALLRPAADLEMPLLAAAAFERLTSVATTPPEDVTPWYRTRRNRRGLRGHIFAPLGGAETP